MNNQKQHGFNLIELMVIIAVLGFLFAFGVPTMSEMIANSRVRTAAEGVLNGMQLARAEAVRRNTPVELRIGADGVSWNIVLAGTPVIPAPTDILHTRAADGGSASVVATPSLAKASVTAAAVAFVSRNITFDGWGMVKVDGGGAEKEIVAAVAIRYNNNLGTARAMCVTIVSNTPRLCDPQRTVAINPDAYKDPQACYSGNNFISGC